MTDSFDAIHPAVPSSTAMTVLSTRDVSPPQRLEYWLDVVCSMYCRLDCQAPDGEDLFGQVQFARLGDVDFSYVTSNGRRLWRGEALDSNSEGHCVVLVPNSGAMVLRQVSREAIAGPGDVVLHDCTRPYELLFGQASHSVYAMRFPRNRLQRHVSNLDDLTATTIDARSVAGQLLLSMVQTLHREAGAMHPCSALGVSEGIASIVAAGLRSLPAASLRRPSQLSAYLKAQVMAYVNKNLRDPRLSPASIAEAMRMQLRDLSRLFEDEPQPLSLLIQRLRLEACRGDLADARLASLTISQIAYSWGFGDWRHFGRCFRGQYGMSPREWRQQALKSVGVPPRQPAE